MITKSLLQKVLYLFLLKATYHIPEANHRFNPEAVDWGFSQFHRIAYLTLPVEKDGKPLLENDSFDVWVHIRTYSDPTGTLWHSFNKYTLLFVGIFLFFCVQLGF